MCVCVCVREGSGGGGVDCRTHMVVVFDSQDVITISPCSQFTLSASQARGE